MRAVQRVRDLSTVQSAVGPIVNSSFRVGAAVALSVALALACATDLPIASDRIEAALPPGASVYLAVRTGQLDGLIDDIAAGFSLDTEEIDDIIADSDRIVAAVGSTDHPERFSAAAAGSYPGGRIRFGLTMSRRWRRRRVDTAVSSRPWFEERDGVGQLAIPSNRLVFFSDGGMEDMVRRAAEEKAGEQSVRLDRGAELSLLLPELGARMREGLPGQAQLLPIERIEVNVRFHEQDREDESAVEWTGGAQLPFEVYGAVEMRNEQSARVFSVIARLVIASLAEGVPLSDLTVSREGSVITFGGLPADEARLREWNASFLATIASS